MSVDIGKLARATAIALLALASTACGEEGSPSEHYVDPTTGTCTHGMRGTVAHPTPGLCPITGHEVATCIGAEHGRSTYVYTPEAADLLQRTCPPGATFTRFE